MDILSVNAPGFVVAWTSRTVVLAVGGVVVNNVVVGFVVALTVVVVSVRTTVKLVIIEVCNDCVCSHVASISLNKA